MRQLLKHIEILSLSAAATASFSLYAAPSMGTCGPTATQIDFNVEGQKDYSIGKDAKNNGDGWYFDAQGGEIVVPNKNKSGELCVQMGTRLAGAGQSNRDNDAGPQKCGSGIDGTRSVTVEGSHGPEHKDYLWQWVKDPGQSAGDDSGYLRITPLDSTGKALYPIIKVYGSANKAQGQDKANSGIRVVEQNGASGGGGNLANPSEQTLFDVNSDNSSGAPGTPVVCTVGKVTSKDKERDWDKDKGLTQPDNGGNSQTVKPSYADATR